MWVFFSSSLKQLVDTEKRVLLSGIPVVFSQLGIESSIELCASCEAKTSRLQEWKGEILAQFCICRPVNPKSKVSIEKKLNLQKKKCFFYLENKQQETTTEFRDDIFYFPITVLRKACHMDTLQLI